MLCQLSPNLDPDLLKGFRMERLCANPPSNILAIDRGETPDIADVITFTNGTSMVIKRDNPIKVMTGGPPSYVGNYNLALWIGALSLGRELSLLNEGKRPQSP